MLTISQILAQELGQKHEYVENVIALLDEGKRRKEEVDG